MNFGRFFKISRSIYGQRGIHKIPTLQFNKNWGNHIYEKALEECKKAGKSMEKITEIVAKYQKPNDLVPFTWGRSDWLKKFMIGYENPNTPIIQMKGDCGKGDPCACPPKKDKGSCGKKKDDSCGKKKDPCGKKKEDPCGKKKDDPCGKKKEDPCGKKKDDSCGKKKQDPCGKKKENPCGKKKEDSCGKKKQDSCGKKKEDPCGKKKSCAPRSILLNEQNDNKTKIEESDFLEQLDIFDPLKVNSAKEIQNRNKEYYIYNKTAYYDLNTFLECHRGPQPSNKADGENEDKNKDSC